jgi:hypothetical protein
VYANHMLQYFHSPEDYVNGKEPIKERSYHMKACVAVKVDEKNQGVRPGDSVSTLSSLSSSLSL